MKNRSNLLLGGLLIIFAGATSLGQKVEPQRTSGFSEPRFPQQPCPVVSVSCPSDPSINEPILFTATISGNLSAKLTYNWEVHGGVITEGQGTPAIMVKVAKYQTVTATLYVGGFDPACGRTASCSTPIHHPFPPAQKFDFYGVLPVDKEEARLDLFGTALKNQPGVKAYILGYDTPGLLGEAQKSVDRAKTYLVDKLGIDQGRIITVDGGAAKGQLTVDLYLVPLGSIPPSPEPTVDPTKVKPMKATATKKAKRP